MWDWIDKASQVTGILAFLPILGTLWLVWGQERRRKRELKAIREAPGSRPTILIIDVGPASIRAQVENWLGKQEALRSILEDSDRIHCLDYSQDRLRSEETDRIIKDLRQALEKITTAGADKIHLFLRVPVVLGVMIGAELSNRTPVILYHHQPNSGYENWGPLHR